MNIYKSIGLFCILFLPLLSVQGQDPAKQLIALPEGTVYDRLSNGLHYIIRQNDLPGSKIEFRLIIRAGAILQTPEEGGCAHFVEHMAFNGTKNFPGKGIVQYLESLGVKYGFGINAFTGFDRTIYMFSIPTDRPEDLDQALLILGDWLTGMSIDPVEVEREKGVIVEEARGYDLGDAFYDLKIGKSRYKERMPLGTMEEIRQMTPERLRTFYEKWYTTELATIVLVGDLDIKQAEQKVRQILGSLPATTSKGYKQYPLEYTDRIEYAGVQDTNINNSSLELIIPHECTIQSTYGDLIAKQKEDLLITVLGNRLKDMKLDVSVSNNWYLSDKDHLVFSMNGKNREELLPQINRVANVLKQIRKEGFDEAELERPKARAVKNLGRKSGVKSSEQWCEDFVDLVISQERYLQDTIHKTWMVEKIQAIDGKALQRLAEKWFGNIQHMLVAYRYNPGNGEGFTAKEIEEVWKQGEKEEYTKYVFVPKEEAEEEKLEIPACLTRKITPAPERIAAERMIDGLGVKDILLKNGTCIILKPTKDEDRQIVITAFAPGGLSLLDAREYPLLEGAAAYMEMGGLEKVDYDTYSSLLAQEDMSLNMSLEQYWHGFMAMAPADKSTELCHLIYEKCFYPEKRYQDFEDARKDMLESLGEETVLSKMLKNDPERQLAARIDELMGNALANGKAPETREQIESLNLDSMAAFYQRLYTNPDGMTYVVCGNFDVQEVERNLVAVVGAFPKHVHPNAFRDPGFALPRESFREEFPNDNKSQTVFDYLFSGNYEAGLRNSLTLKLVRDVVRNRLLKTLREQESLVYSPYISLFYKGYPIPSYYFDINASVDSKNMEKIDRIIKEIIREVQENEVDAGELAALQRSFVVTRREVVNDYATAEWRKYLSGALRDGETLDELARYDEILYSITSADLKAACRKLFDPDKCVLLHMGIFGNTDSSVTSK